MKNKFLLSILSIFITFNLFAQITITDGSGTPINNGDIRIFNTDGDEANLIMAITNNASEQIELNLKAVSITGADGSGLEFCFGISCYMGISAGTIYPLSDAFYIDAGATDSGTHFHHHIQSGDPDVTEYVLKIYEAGNEANNYVQFTYKYDANYVGIKNTEKTLISLFPNPATKFITVKIPENLKTSELIVTNILGRTIARRQLKNTKTTVNTETYSPGIYFVSIISESNIIETKKLIIKK